MFAKEIEELRVLEEEVAKLEDQLNEKWAKDLKDFPIISESSKMASAYVVGIISGLKLLTTKIL